MADVSAHVIVSGRVQGVFFREETRRAAERLGVSGWVRNRSDGTVEAVFEGPRATVEAAIDWCRQGSPMSRVADVRVTWQVEAGEPPGFVIRPSA
ncbi:acylphosphatase [Desulfatitalea alkaliphila]|uniref:Acylphosphatase n=1 Tax=Desulfatitalea alkaliphila TaxID=2929485 RepID=A0AA41R174_9BACT|nr:acylphosphatase [Desulfatitalea alkaliphila]MCJ8499983.1 acylphosphatase [Desulfatitalea alkaliphila]